MRSASNSIGLGAVLCVLGTAIFSVANAQSDPARFDQLRAQYKLVKVSLLGVIQGPGTPMTVQKQGIFALGAHGAATPTATYADGVMHPASKSAAFLGGGAKTRWFVVGELVFPMALEIDFKNNGILLTAVSLDGLKGRVRFQFPSGFLATADTMAIQDVISQVFSINQPIDGKKAAPAEVISAEPAQPAATPQFDPIAPPPPPADEPVRAPITISIGDSKEQVVAAFGQPEKIVRLERREIYYFKDLKVTFTDGKVSNVE